MINTNELRIGNWVYDGKMSRFPMQIETVTKYSVYLDFEGNEGDVFVCSDKEIVPIHLTLDLLKNLNERSFSSKPPFFMNDIEFDYSYEEFIVIPSVANRKWHIGSPIKYVHQLQNVVFALSGKELYIKKHFLSDNIRTDSLKYTYRKDADKYDKEIKELQNAADWLIRIGLVRGDKHCIKVAKETKMKLLKSFGRNDKRK